MMTFSPINEEQYDLAAGTIIYGKLFPKLLKDFITREDAKMMMKQSNLIVQTNVQVAIPAGTGTGVGVVNVIYSGDQPSPGSKILEQRRKLEKELGTVQVEEPIEALKTVAGE